MRNEEIVKALRCISTAGVECAEDRCPYWTAEEVPEEYQAMCGTGPWM